MKKLIYLEDAIKSICSKCDELQCNNTCVKIRDLESLPSPDVIKRNALIDYKYTKTELQILTEFKRLNKYDSEYMQGWNDAIDAIIEKEKPCEK